MSDAPWPLPRRNSTPTPIDSSETADAVQDTAACEAACTAFFVTTRSRPEAERMAAAVAALIAVRPATPYSRATDLAGLMVLHAKREAHQRWMYRKRPVKAALRRGR